MRNSVSDVTLCMTIGNRPQLLDLTLSSLLSRCKFEHVIGINDFGDAASNEVFRKYFPYGTLVSSPPRQGHHQAIDLLYENINTKYIFHIEDDWEFKQDIPFKDIFDILESNAEISAVCLRETSDFVSADFCEETCRVNNGRLNWYNLTGLHTQWFGYTFNPHITTKRLIKSITPYSTYKKERHISRTLRARGMYVAYLNNGGCRHIGDAYSVSNVDKIKNLTKIKNIIGGVYKFLKN